MKKILSLLFAGLFLLLCLIPSVGLLLTGGSGAAANQVLAPKPVPQKRDGGLNTAYLEDLSRYVNDRFSLRQEAVTLWAKLNSRLFGSSVTENVVIGRDGWLYFKPSFPDYCRTESMNGRELWCAARRLYLLQEYAEGQGAHFLFTIAPNKNSLYPANMPSLPRNELPSDSEALAGLLGGMGVRYLDLFSVFRAQDEVLYFPRDSHWNGRGAALAADAILEALGRESSYFDSDFTEGSHLGDLYEMLYPAGKETDPDLVYAPGFRFSASSENADSITITTESPDGRGALLMYRDSFGRSLYPYLAEAYAEAVFSRKNDYDPSALVPGGALVVEVVERNLRYLIDNPLTMPAPERDPALADGAAVSDGTIPCRVLKGAPEGSVLLEGDLSAFAPDEDSPVWLSGANGLYEAVPGPNAFRICLPSEALEGPIRVIFRAGGLLLSLDGSLN